jgi:hypothetical protein
MGVFLFVMKTLYALPRLSTETLPSTAALLMDSEMICKDAR